MSTALILAQATGQAVTQWNLADNTIQTVSIPEMQEALLLAITEKGRIIGVVE